MRLNQIGASAFLAVLSISPAGGQGTQEAASSDQGFLTWYSVGAPIGKILLMRKESNLCAVKFTSATRGNDKTRSTTFDSGDESFFGEYDWQQLSLLENQTVTLGPSGHRRLTQKALKGIGRLAFQLGDTTVKCGSFALTWGYPTSVSLYAGARRGNQGIEMAPTRWSDFRDVSLGDPNLKWYGYDEDRKPTYVQIK